MKKSKFASLVLQLMDNDFSYQESITAVKIEGIPHEFSVIPGVKEDAITILLNLKKIRLNVVSDEPQTLTLKVKGAKEVKAGDIKVSGGVEILNPDIISLL